MKPDLGIRKSIFEETHAKITEHNSKTNATYKMGHNAFSVMVFTYHFESFREVNPDPWSLLLLFHKTEDEQQSHFGALEPVPPSNLPGISSERQLSRVSQL